MGRLHAHVRPHVRAHVRSPLSGRAGGLSVHDGISFTASNGRVVIKAPGAAPTITTLTSAFTFTGGNQSMYRGPSGLLIQSVTNTPRIEYGPGGDVLGLLMEASRTNLLLQSQTLDNASWAKSNLTVTADQIAGPDGTTTADKIAEDATAGVDHFMSQNVAVNVGEVHTFSCFFKAAEQSWVRLQVNAGAVFAASMFAFFNVSTGVVGTVSNALGATITPYANGWYRCSFRTTAATGTGSTGFLFYMASADNQFAHNGTNGAGVYGWGAQDEVGAFASSYIPTTTVSVARTADSCIRTLSTEFSATAGTVVVAGRASGGQDAANGNHFYEFDNGTAAERIRFFRALASDTARVQYTSASVTQALLDATFVNLTAFKHATAWAANDFASSFNGAAVLTDAAGTVPTITTLGLGMSPVGADCANGHIRTFDYYSVRMPNEFLVARST